MATTMMLNKKMRILSLLEKTLGKRFRKYASERFGAITWAIEYQLPKEGPGVST
jgi:hypothetical protein